MGRASGAFSRALGLSGRSRGGGQADGSLRAGEGRGCRKGKGGHEKERVGLVYRVLRYPKDGWLTSSWAAVVSGAFVMWRCFLRKAFQDTILFFLLLVFLVV